MRSLSGWLLAITGFLACPCHLPLTLPILLALLGGTSLGLFLQQNTGLVIAAATAYFLGALGFGLVLLTRSTPRDDRRLCCSLDQSLGPAKDRQSEPLAGAVKTGDRR